MQGIGTTKQSELSSSAAPSGAGSGKGMLWTGRIISGFVALFLLFDGVARFVRFAPYVDGLAKFGYPVSLAPWIGLALVISTVLYIIPGSNIIGAILVTAYLGGATASHVRIQEHNVWFPVMMGVLAWVGLYLRDQRVRSLIPLRKLDPTSTEAVSR